MAQTKKTPRVRRGGVQGNADTRIIATNEDKAYLIAGLLTACMFGIPMLMEAMGL